METPVQESSQKKRRTEDAEGREYWRSPFASEIWWAIFRCLSYEELLATRQLCHYFYGQINDFLRLERKERHETIIKVVDGSSRPLVPANQAKKYYLYNKTDFILHSELADFLLKSDFSRCTELTLSGPGLISGFMLKPWAIPGNVKTLILAFELQMYDPVPVWTKPEKPNTGVEVLYLICNEEEDPDEPVSFLDYANRVLSTASGVKTIYTEWAAIIETSENLPNLIEFYENGGKIIMSQGVCIDDVLVKETNKDEAGSYVLLSICNGTHTIKMHYQEPAEGAWVVC